MDLEKVYIPDKLRFTSPRALKLKGGLIKLKNKAAKVEENHL